MRSRANPWIGITLDAWRLGVETSAVMALRTVRIAQGGEAGRLETERMVAEKFEAALALQALALTGGLGATPVTASRKTLAHYRRKVRANRRRLGGA